MSYIIDLTLRDKCMGTKATSTLILSHAELNNSISMLEEMLKQAIETLKPKAMGSLLTPTEI